MTTMIKPRTIVISTIGGTSTLNTISMNPHAQLLTAMSPESDTNANGQPRKRQRLTHLTPDERMMRRKLKNRVAAQLARDRKRDKMSELDTRLGDIQAENRRLMAENEALRKRTEELSSENSGLRSQLGDVGSSLGVNMKSETLSPESAEEQDRVEAPHNGLNDLPLTPPNAQPDILALLEEISQTAAAQGQDHVSNAGVGRTCSQAEQKAVALSVAAEKPSVVGASATELESLKELIKFDHIYYKSPSDVDSKLKQEKLVVVSLPDIVCKPVEQLLVPTLASQVTSSTSDSNLSAPKLNPDNDILRFMDVDIIESLSELLDLDGLLDESITNNTTTNINNKSSSETNIISSVSSITKDNIKSLISTKLPEKAVLTVKDTTVTKRGKKRASSGSLDRCRESLLSVPGGDNAFGLDSCRSPLSSCDSDYSSDDFFTASPENLSSPLSVDTWEESFTELFPSLL